MIRGLLTDEEWPFFEPLVRRSGDDRASETWDCQTRASDLRAAFERSARLIEQMELQLEETEAAAKEDELAIGQAVATTNVAGFTRRHPVERNTFPDHLPRDRVVIEAPTACACCGGTRLRTR